MSPGQGTEKVVEAQANRVAESEPSEKARSSFVGGCQRSGTTAFADYPNLHRETLSLMVNTRNFSRAFTSRPLSVYLACQSLETAKVIGYRVRAMFITEGANNTRML